MFGFRCLIICCLMLAECFSLKSAQSTAKQQASSKDFIQELRLALPELLQTDLESLFGGYSETFAKLQIFADNLAKHDKFVITSKNLQTFLSSKNLKTFSRYVTSAEFDKRLEIMQERNPILVALAKKWIRNAALRVFADPLRSFLELIANACDATVGPDKAVGKFGMGFFSILSFLLHQETDGTFIKINTVSKRDLEREDFFAYSMTFEKSGSEPGVWDDLIIKFSHLKGDELNQFLRELKPSYIPGAKVPTGTIVTIIPKNAQTHFSIATLSTLKKYVGHMVNYPWVPVYLNDDQESINKNAQSPEALTAFPVNVFVLPNELKVIDRGVGISLVVALSSLLIPASSTKPKPVHSKIDPELLAIPDFVSLPYKSDGTQSHFLITVKGTVVVDKIIGESLRNEGEKAVDFEIKMPQITKLTLARDEILISEDGTSFEEAYLKNVINKTITDVIDRKLSSNHLAALYKGLVAWEMQTASRYIKGRFTNYFKQLLQDKLQKNESAIVVPIHYFDQLQKIFKYFTGVNAGSYSLLPIDGGLVNYDFSRFEKVIIDLAINKISQSDEAANELMRNAINYQLIRGMRVIFVPQDCLDKISVLGMQTLLFVPKLELDDISNISENIVAKCTELDLLPSDSKKTINATLIISTFADRLGFYARQDVSGNKFTIFNKSLTDQFLKNYGFLLQAKNGQFRGILADKFVLSLFGISTPSLPIDCEKHLNFVLTSMLSGFGVTVKNSNKGQIYFVNTSGFFEKIWPLDTVSAENLARLLFMISWYQVNHTDLCFSDDIDSGMRARDYFLRLCYREISVWHMGDDCITFTSYPHQIWRYSVKDGIDKIIQPFKIFGFDLYTQDDFDFKLINLTTPVLVERKDATQSAIKSEVQDLIKFVAPAANYDQTLKFACDNFSLVNVFAHLFLFRNSAMKIIVNKNIQSQILNLIDAFSGFYLQYCNIPENEFCKVYGSSNKIKVLSPTPQVDASMITETLNILGGNPKSFERVLQLQIDDFTRQTDVVLRAAELVQNRLYLPLITANTVLSTITKFFYSLAEIPLNRKIALVNQIIDLAQSAQDLIFILQLLMVDNNLSLVRSSIAKQTAAQFRLFMSQIKDLVQRYIREKVDEYTILDFYEKCRDEQFISLDSRIKSLAETPISGLVYEYLRCTLFDPSAFESKGYQDKIGVLIKDSQIFTLRKLMRAHFTDQGLVRELRRNSLKSVLKKVRKVKVPVDSWKITQAVESGSQRDSAEAAIIENLQNSVDAIKGFFRNLKEGIDQNITQNFDLRIDQSDNLYSIKFDLNIVPGDSTDNAHVLLTVQDFIGMPSLETLLADLVLPDYSKKTHSEGNIGDMGNGTFKIYQAAKSVIITTRLISDPNKIFVLYIVPHRNSEGLVDDLYLQCSQHALDGMWQKFWGTKFEILFKEKNKSDALISLVAAKDFLKTCVGSMHVSVDKNNKNINVYFKNEKLNNISDHNLLFQQKRGDRVLFKIYRRENTLLQSYLTTGGVPFCPLTPVALEMSLLPKNFIPAVSNGLVINFELDTYQPVQSRTRLNIPEEIKRKLQECLFEVFYLYTLEQRQNDRNFLGSIFTHYNSKICQFAQLQLNVSEQTVLSDYMNLFLNGKQVSNILDPRIFFCCYRSLTAIKNLDQQQKSFFEFIDKEFKNGLVKSIEVLLAKHQSAVSKALPDVSLSDLFYIDFCKAREESFDKELKSLFSKWKSKILDAEYEPSTLIHGVVVPWFESKIGGIRLEIKDRNEAKKISKLVAKHRSKFTVTELRDIHSLLETILTAYVNTYFKLNKLAIKVPKISFKLCSDSDVGYFLRKSNEIVVSPRHPMLITNILKMLKALINGQYQDVKNNSAYELLFGVRKGVDCGVIVHELQHSITQTDHSCHDADFENRAKQCIITIISELYSEWSSEVIRLSHNNKSSITEKISKNIESVEELEREDQEAMFVVFGIV